MNTTINFGGFYHTHHEYIIEQAVGNMLGIDDPETGEIDSEALYDFNEWPSVMNSYAKQWLDMLNADLGTSLSFMELNSPREYNFKTDVIFADVPDDDILLIKEYVKHNHLSTSLSEHIKNATTSYDGYRAFYSGPDLELPENEDVLIQLMLDVIIEDLGVNYPYICEDFYS